LENKISSVLDLLDTQLGPRQVEKAREVQGTRMNFPIKRKFFNTSGQSEGRIAAGSHVQM
jgi:hypothetical protein